MLPLKRNATFDFKDLKSIENHIINFRFLKHCIFGTEFKHLQCGSDSDYRQHAYNMPAESLSDLYI